MAFAKEFVLVDHKQHHLKAFGCGKPDMDEYLARFAIKNSELGINRTWVLTALEKEDVNSKLTVAAYFTLANSTVRREQIPTNVNLPRYPVPVILLARLAVDKKFQGLHLGEKTLITALRKANSITKSGLPAVGLILDVLDEGALTFYQKYEIFHPFTDNPMRIFCPTSVLSEI